MLKRLIPLTIVLFTATAAFAQMGGGGMGGGGMGGGGMGGGGGGGHGRGGGGGHGGKAPTTKPADTPDPAKPAPTAVNQVEIIGVVKAIDPATDRMTIAYEPVEAFGWPAGAQPFPVAKHALMNGVTVGEKVRFSLDSSQVSALRPF